jgi:hypothetical protein
MYQNPLDLLIKMLDEMKKKYFQNNTKCTQKKNIFLPKATPL